MASRTALLVGFRLVSKRYRKFLRLGRITTLTRTSLSQFRLFANLRSFSGLLYLSPAASNRVLCVTLFASNVAFYDVSNSSMFGLHGDLQFLKPWKEKQRPRERRIVCLCLQVVACGCLNVEIDCFLWHETNHVLGELWWVVWFESWNVDNFARISAPRAIYFVRFSSPLLFFSCFAYPISYVVRLLLTKRSSQKLFTRKFLFVAQWV